MEAVAKEDKVQLVGFGTFEVRARGERTGRNPAPRNRLSFRLPSSLFSRPARRLRTPWRNKVFISTICNCWQERGEEAECFLSIFISSVEGGEPGASQKGRGYCGRSPQQSVFLTCSRSFICHFASLNTENAKRSFFSPAQPMDLFRLNATPKSGGNPQDSRRFLG